MSARYPRHLLHTVRDTLAQEKLIPLWDATPPFAFDRFSEQLQQAFRIADLQVASGTAEWKKEDAITAGFGEHPFVQAIELSPISEPFFIVIPPDDLEKFSGWVLDKESKKGALRDKELQKGFCKFIILQALSSYGELYSPPFSPKLSSFSLAKEESYCVDVSLTRGKQTLWVRLVFPNRFHTHYNHFMAEQALPLSELANDMNLPLHVGVKIGAVSLPFTAWQSVKQGDFIRLDSCSFHPSQKKGTLELTLFSTPLFHAKLKESGIKLLDYASYGEDETMIEKTNDQEGIEEPFEELLQGFESPVEDLIATKEVPLSLSVELGKLSIQLSNLLNLKPGNVLSTSMNPNQGVNLVLNGRCVARGELIETGTVIGVKVTEIG